MTLRSHLKQNIRRLDILFFYTTAFVSLFAVLVCSVFTYYETKNTEALIFILIGGLPLILILLFTGKKISYDLGQLLTVTEDTCVLIPFGFFRFGGSNSGIPVCFLGLAAFVMVCQSRRYRKAGLAVLVGVICLLFYLEGQYPEMIQPLQAETVRADIIFCVFFGLFGECFIIGTLMFGYTEHASDQRKAMENKNRMYKNLLEQESDRNDYLRRFRHDVRHHNNVLLELLAGGHYDRVISYLKEYERAGSTDTGRSFCVNLMLNSILQYMDRLCRKNGIEFIVAADVAENIPVKDDDFSAMAANIIENAVNGALESGMEGKKIMFRAVTKGERLTLICENTCSAEITVRNSMLSEYSTGVRSIMAAMEQYDGTLSYEKTEENRIRCSLLLNLKYQQSEA